MRTRRQFLFAFILHLFRGVYSEIENTTKFNDMDNSIVVNESFSSIFSSTQAANIDSRELIAIFQHFLHQTQLTNDHLVGLRSAITQLKTDVNGLNDNLASLKNEISESTIDLQSDRNSIEIVEDWTASIDSKLRNLEKLMKFNCLHRHKRAEKRKRNKYTKEAMKLREVETEFQTNSSAFSTNSFDDKSTFDIKLELLKLSKCCSEFPQNRRPSSCADIQVRPGLDTKLTSGPKAINPALFGYDSYLNVFCDFETEGGGWTVFQRRSDWSIPRENFERNWTEYKIGFGDVSGELWLGNDALFALTNQEPVELRIELEDFEDEVKYAEYSLFRVTDEKNHFKIHLGKYSGNAADSMGRSREMPFSTKDVDNDKWTGNCAQRFRGGWWFNNCHDANLNGYYYGGEHESYADGVNWYHWTGFHYSLKRTEMKIRPIWFAQQYRKNPSITEKKN